MALKGQGIVRNSLSQSFDLQNDNIHFGNFFLRAGTILVSVVKSSQQILYSV